MIGVDLAPIVGDPHRGIVETGIGTEKEIEIGDVEAGLCIVYYNFNEELFRSHDRRDKHRGTKDKKKKTEEDDAPKVCSKQVFLFLRKLRVRRMGLRSRKFRLNGICLMIRMKKLRLNNCVEDVKKCLMSSRTRFGELCSHIFNQDFRTRPFMKTKN